MNFGEIKELDMVAIVSKKKLPKQSQKEKRKLEQEREIRKRKISLILEDNDGKKNTECSKAVN